MILPLGDFNRLKRFCLSKNESRQNKGRVL